jgi:outer membrane protein TolC
LVALGIVGMVCVSWSQPQTLPEAARMTLATDPDSVLLEELERIPGDPLGLDGAIDRALAHATAIGEAEANLRAAMAVVRREKGPFDPELFAEYDVDVQDVPSASPFAGADVVETDERTSSIGARMRFSTGTQLEAAIDTRRLETNSRFATLNPQYVSNGRLALTQPLLKGLGPAARAPLSAAERDLEGARSQYESTVWAIRADVEQVYWALYAAERNLAVERLVRDRAESFLELAQTRARVGLVGPNEAANAEVFLAQEKQAVLDREEELGSVSDRLATLLGQRPAAGQTRFRSTAEPPQRFDMMPPDSVVQLALRHNYDLMVAEKRVEALHALERGAGWDALPTLDFVGTLGGNGLSGTGQDVIFGGDTLRTNVDGGFGDTWSQVFGHDFPTWSLGLRLSVPLGLREGRGERDRLRAEVLRAEKQLEALRRDLEEAVRTRHRELSNAELRFAAAREGVDASLRQVRIGMLEYESGRTTAFEIVRLAEDVATAQQRYSQALVRAAQAAAELRLLTAGHFPALPSP